MIVSNDPASVTVCWLTLTPAPGTCQNPVAAFTLWGSRVPVHNLSFVPPRNSSEPCLASLNPKTDCETAFCLVAVLKNGSPPLRLAIAGKASPRIYRGSLASAKTPNERTHSVAGVVNERCAYRSRGREDLSSDLDPRN